ncbi:uncharacterized protein B0T15DRAFT_247447 [Chaetomium strumarium]|uniref:Uncharacterized protein n=1 Tax=Chaetomium strumarium TaxID=1170767 RepID=A0AAJ0M0L5_9PEZI|nr:hypothetical protein B0T15DRAFT_247447 [Chaetomium strumarium]
MGSYINPDEIQHFLSRYRRSAVDDDQEPYFGYANQPRGYQPAAAGNGVLEDTSSSEFDDWRSEVTMTSTVKSPAYTVSTGRSAARSSVFSQDDSRSLVGPSSAPSSAPSVGVPQMTWMQQFGNPVAPPPVAHQILWCEFSGLMGCQATFGLDEENRWIEHHAAHLNGLFPQRLICWFCDDFKFVAENPTDGHANFVQRMQHVRDHIWEDHRLTSGNNRPDFDMVQHLYACGLLSEERYDWAMSFDESPYPLPGSHSHPSLAQGPKKTIIIEREKGRAHDLAKEKRELRRKKERKVRR